MNSLTGEADLGIFFMFFNVPESHRSYKKFTTLQCTIYFELVNYGLLTIYYSKNQNISRERHAMDFKENKYRQQSTF